MNQQFYTDVSRECAQHLTKRYSTSFSMGIRLFAKPMREPIYSIYGFVRLADEIVDTFHTSDKSKLLKQLRAQVYQAIEEKISLNPILEAFQHVVNDYNIPMEYIDAFLDSMEMDLTYTDYDRVMYEKYIYGSAEVIGLMCLKIFVTDSKEFDRLVPYARALGSAFQKINFLRDIQSDFEDRGRVYFPNLDYQDFNVDAKLKIEEDIQKDFDKGLEGIMQLPKSCRQGVLLSYRYYTLLFKKIQVSRPSTILSERLRIPNRVKVQVLLRTLLVN